MKGFLKTVLWFFVPVMLAACLADYFLSVNLAKSVRLAQGEFLVWQDIYNGKIDADITVNGSSRAWLHFDPAIMESGLNQKVYNIGIDGHSFLLQDFRYKELVKHNRAPKCIIYSVDIFTLVKRDELYNSMQFLPYMLWNKDMYETTSKYQGFSAWDSWIPLVRYAGQHEAMAKAVDIALHGEHGKPKRTKGYLGNVQNWNSDLEKAQSKTEKFVVKPLREYQIAFEEFLGRCKQDGQTVVLVYSPEEIHGQQFIGNRDAVVALYRDIAKRHGLLFLDYSNDPMCLDKKYFYNALHLNRDGSALFTQKLVDDLKRANVFTPR